MSQLPTFLVIGAARSGTTALYEFLRQHPGIYLSRIKETNFFAFDEGPVGFAGPGAEFVNNSIRSLDEYRGLFEAAPSGAAIGEISPLYLYSPAAPARIAKALPAVKLIAILRNPVEQAYSHYLYARAQMIEPLESFDDALLAQAMRLEAGWQPLFQYSSFPRYGEQLTRYLQYFDRSQLQVFLYDEFLNEPARVLREIFDFIGVDGNVTVDTSPRVNRGGAPRSRLLQWAVMRPNIASAAIGAFLPERVRRYLRDLVSSRNIERTSMSAGARSRLAAELADDVRLLGSLLGRDLSDWR